MNKFKLRTFAIYIVTFLFVLAGIPITSATAQSGVKTVSPAMTPASTRSVVKGVEKAIDASKKDAKSKGKNSEIKATRSNRGK